MRGKIKTARREASKLHGATATFVSLVDAGANETPFTMIKSKDGAKAMTIKKRKTAAKKSHKPLTSAKKGGSDAVETRTETLIAKMVFDGDMFEDEQSVRDYIEKAEWEADEIEVVQNSDGDWEARSDGLTDEDFTKIGKVDTDEDGVEAFVGQREVEVKTEDTSDDDTDEEDDEADTEAKSDDDADDEAETETKDDASDDDAEDEDDAPAATTEEKGKKKPVSKRSAFIKRRKETKAKETVAKFDAWDARFSKGNTLAKTLADGMEWDGLPPGYYDVQAAAQSAFANIVSDEGLTPEQKQEALNKAALDMAEIVGGLDTFFDAYVGADEETVAKAYDDDKERVAVAKWADGYADFVADEPAPETVAKAAGDASVAIDYSKVTETVQDIIAKAVGPLTEQIDAVSETVEAISTRAPTKKAAAPEDGGSAGPRKVKQKAGASKEDEGPDATERFAKSFLG